MASPEIPRPQHEAERLTTLFDGPGLLQFLTGQLGVVKHQAQLLLGLCGLAITVTGFSGTQMIQSGWFSAAAMVAGIALILVGAVISLRAIVSVRWVSQELDDSLVETAARIIQHRNLQQRRLAIASVFVGFGLGAYLLAVAIAATVHHV